MPRLLLVLLVTGSALHGADYKAGLASIVITPKEPLHLSGYASRTKPSQGTIQDLKARALAIEDSGKNRVVIVTTDLLGLPRHVSDAVAARVHKTYGLDRARLLLNSSHTHTGPLIGTNLNLILDISPEQARRVEEYTAGLIDDLVTLVGAAMRNLEAVNLAFGNGAVHFAVNRREPGPNGIRIGVNPAGPTDPDVPVLRVTAPNGQLRAVLFGYACHNTTLTGEFYKFSGDYAGFAQNELEGANPGATALFMMLCGADQNPNPRGTLELARQHGETLAAEVTRVLRGSMQPVRGSIRAAFQIIDLEFAHHTREMYEARLQDTNRWRARHARNMLRAYDERRPIRQYPYPVQAIAFGSDLVIVALGGEVVVDYCLRIKKQFGAKGIVIAGYSNDVMAYIPSLRVLKEGGYEADSSMIYYNQPGPWAENVEERVFSAVQQVLKRLGRVPR